MSPAVRVPEPVELDPSCDALALAEAARDAGQEVCLFGRQTPGATLLLGIGRRFDLVSSPGGAALEDPEGHLLDREAGPPLGAAARLWRRLTEVEPGLVALGGFAFDPGREPARPWAGFPALLFRVPALLVVWTDGRITAHGDLARLEQPPAWSAGEVRRFSLEPTRPEREWMHAVAKARARLRAGEAGKVVLAREVTAHADGPLAAGRVVRALSRRHPGCFLYLVTGADGTAFAGASPELLLRRQGRRVVSHPMAGSAPRGATAAEDQELARRLLESPKEAMEHRTTTVHVSRALAGLGAAVEHGRPEVVRLANIQHLATLVGGWLPEPPPDLLEVAERLHPTPAVGGEPAAAARGMIRELERMERGWYGGAVGWMDGSGDGELAVAIRCSLLSDDGARLYAGCGIMPDSDPAAELAETRLKLGALLESLGIPTPAR